MLVSLTLLPFQRHGSTTHTVFDHERLPTGYTIFRKDRVDRRRGGVLMAFKYDITVWRRNDLVSDCELLWCESLLLRVKRFYLVHIIVRQILKLSISNCLVNLSLLLTTNSIRYF